MCGGWGTSLYHEWPLIAFAFPQIFLQYSRMRGGIIILLAKLNYMLSPVFSNEQPIQNYDIVFNFQSTQPDFHQTPNNRQNLNGKHFRKAKERFAMMSWEKKESLKVLFLPTPAVKCRNQRQILWIWRWQSMSLQSAVSLMSDLICSDLCESWILWSFGEFIETKGFSYEQTEQDLIKELWIN